MDSLSRRRAHRSFSSYDDVFSGGGKGVNGIEDYKEIFRGSTSSSIPVLDLSALDGASDVERGRKGRKVDYDKIFGGVVGDDVAESYDEVFAKRTPAKTRSYSDQSTSPGRQIDEEYQREIHNQSLEGVKQYSTYYNRTSQISKDGKNGMTHVAQMKAVPGYTCFIDESVQKTGDKSGSVPKDIVRPTPKVSFEHNKKQPTDSTEILKSQPSRGKFSSVDKNVDANGSSIKPPSFTLSSPTSVPSSSAREKKRSGEIKYKVPKSGASKTSPGDCSPSSSDEEPIADSAAAVSAAALRKAVREAEASIRLAKEIMERTKNGLQKFPKPRSKEGLDVKKKKLKEIGQIGVANEGVRETDGAKSNSFGDGQVHITMLERKKARRSCKVVPSSSQSEETCVIKKVSGKSNEKLEISDSKSDAQFPELLKMDRQNKENLDLEQTERSNIRLIAGTVSEKVKEEDNWENSADTKTLGQVPEFVKAQEQGLSNSGLQLTNGDKIMSSVSIASEKPKEDKLELSTGSKSLVKFPESVKVENKKAANFNVGEANGENIKPSIHWELGKVKETQLELSNDTKVAEQLFENQRTANFNPGRPTGNNILPSVDGVLGEEIENRLEISGDSKAAGESPEIVKSENARTLNLELEHPNVENIFPSLHKVSKKVNEDKLELAAQSRVLEKSPELMKPENQRTANLEQEQTNGIMPSFMNLFGKIKEKLELSFDSKALPQFPEFLKTDNQKTVTLDSETNGSYTRPATHNISAEVTENWETSAYSAALGLFPELMNPDNQRTATLELDHTNDSTISSPVHNLSEEVKEELVISSDSKALDQFSELGKTDDGRTSILELEHTNRSISKPSIDNLIEELSEDKLGASIDMKAPEQIAELVKADEHRTVPLELEPTNSSNTEPAVNKDELEVPSNGVLDKLGASIDMKAPEQIAELVKADEHRTVPLELEPTNSSNTKPAVYKDELEVPSNGVLDLECTNSSDIKSSVDNVPIEVIKNTPEPSVFPELVKTDNQTPATLEFGEKTGSNMMPPVDTNERGETENQTDGVTSELLEIHSKEVHRKRKQWKDVEAKPSDIKIAEEGGQFVHDTTAAQEVHGQEDGISEEHGKEYRKRRQWKDVKVKPCDIKIADDGEIIVDGQDKREKAVLDNDDVEVKHETSSSEELFEKEVIESQDQEKNEGSESLGMKPNHSEEPDEDQKSKVNGSSTEPDNAELLKDVNEEKETVEHMSKGGEIEKKLQESSEWRDFEVTFKVEINGNGQNDDMDREKMNQNGSSDAWKEENEHLGDTSSEGSEKMSDASQSSFDYKEDLDFDELVGESLEVFQSCEFKANQPVEEPIEHEVTIKEDSYSHHFDSVPDNVSSNDEDAADGDRNDSELVKSMSVGINDPEQRLEENNAFDFKSSFEGNEEARGIYEQEWVRVRNRKEAAQPPDVLKEEISGTGEVQEKSADAQKEVKVDETTSKRERERERNRMVVERAIREARERAFAEARERAERAAVEKATAEARERVMAEARQKFEKTNTATKSSTERVSIQAKLRSERAAVERAHAEARERALEKALSQKSTSTSTSNIPSPKPEAAHNGETAERRNARLERTQRTMERAAKALAEKNMRDLRAQKEQAERHRLAETLDSEIKRWSSGKTGNLRALLSTLQYILGPDSGWQPVSLTDIVTTSAVKKAYRKATLHVHPDKLQQRGASIQQKYICEKVFDLLKAAWNKFNSEER